VSSALAIAVPDQEADSATPRIGSCLPDCRGSACTSDYWRLGLLFAIPGRATRAPCQSGKRAGSRFKRSTALQGPLARRLMPSEPTTARRTICFHTKVPYSQLAASAMNRVSESAGFAAPYLNTRGRHVETRKLCTFDHSHAMQRCVPNRDPPRRRGENRGSTSKSVERDGREAPAGAFRGSNPPGTRTPLKMSSSSPLNANSPQAVVAMP